MTLTRALVLSSVLAITGGLLAACGGSSSSDSSTSAAASAPVVVESSAPASAPASTVPASGEAGAPTYCEPLAAAWAIKAESGSQVTDEQLAEFAAALEPAAVAAQADGRQDLYDLFALIAQMNAAPDEMTAEDANLALSQIGLLGPEVFEACGIDLMS